MAATEVEATTAVAMPTVDSDGAVAMVKPPSVAVAMLAAPPTWDTPALPTEPTEPVPGAHCRLTFWARRSLVRFIVLRASATSRLKTPG